MDAFEAAAEALADDAIRMAKVKGIDNPEDVPVEVDAERSEVTTDMIREYVRQNWDVEGGK